MANAVLGFGILVVSGIMLVSMDSYFGIPMLTLKLFGGIQIISQIIKNNNNMHI